MHLKIYLFALITFTIAGCNNSKVTENHDEEDNPKFQYTVYSKDFELFAEADPFVVGDTANVLSHFSWLTDFKPLDPGKIKITLTVNGDEISQTLETPLRKGIYSFNLIPKSQGKGSIKYYIETGNGVYELDVPEVTVFATTEEAHAAAEGIPVNNTNTSVFLKEQSWKINFSTELPEKGAFGQVIKTTAIIQPSPSGEVIITAKASGFVSLSNSNLIEGREISSGQVLFTISGGAMAENNFSVKYSEARNNFEKAKADYERAKELSNDKIVSEKEFLEVKNRYDNARALFENLDQNFDASGQKVKSPVSGYIKQVFVNNGTYVEAGKPLLSISQNKTLILTADVSQKYGPLLAAIVSANIRTLQEDKVYTLEQLNGKVLSYGKSANSSNYLFPVSLQIENNGKFTPGSFVEVYLRTEINSEAITIPNSALLEEQGIFFVYVQVTPELFEKREVVPGVTDGIRTEILNGIFENERIVTKGAVFIKLAQSTGTLDAHSGHVH
jgi:membrane fusion protein, heavy metal efflux system